MSVSISAEETERRRKGPRFSDGFMTGLNASRDLACLCVGGIVSQTNVAALDLLDLPDERSFLGNRFADYVAEDYRMVVDFLLGLHVIEPTPIPVCLRRRDGTLLDVEMAVHPARELGPDHAVVVARDISRQGRLARAAIASEDRFQQLVDQSMNLICRCRGDHVEYINGAGIKLLGRTAPVTGWPVVEMFAPEYAALFTEAPELLLNERDVLPVQLLRQDGGLVHVQLLVTLIDGDGPLPDYMIEARDISPQIRAVSALRQMNEHLEQKVDERTRELAAAAEIRQELIRRLEAEKEAMEREIKAAQDMQFALLPRLERMGEALAARHLTIQAVFEPSSGIGGDLWGCLPLEGGRALVFSFDFAGHGIRAALNTFRLHTLINEYRSLADDPAKMLEVLNGILHGLLPRGHYATMVVAVIDSVARRMVWAGAGAPAPIFRRPDGSAEWLDTRGRPLGLTASYAYVNHETDFPPGASLFLYSDAMTETDDLHGVMYGEERLRELVLGTLSTPSPSLAAMLDVFQSATGVVEDDLTAVLITLAID